MELLNLCAIILPSVFGIHPWSLNRIRVQLHQRGIVSMPFEYHHAARVAPVPLGSFLDQAGRGLGDEFLSDWAWTVFRPGLGRALTALDQLISDIERSRELGVMLLGLSYGAIIAETMAGMHSDVLMVGCYPIDADDSSVPPFPDWSRIKEALLIAGDKDEVLGTRGLAAIYRRADQYPGRVEKRFVAGARHAFLEPWLPTRRAIPNPMYPWLRRRIEQEAYDVIAKWAQVRC